MTDATAALYNVPSLDGRGLPLGNYRRVLNGALVGLGTVAVVCVLVTTVTVAAAWIINTALAPIPISVRRNDRIGDAGPRQIQPGYGRLGCEWISQRFNRCRRCFQMSPLRPNGLARWLPRESVRFPLPRNILSNARTMCLRSRRIH